MRRTRTPVALTGPAAAALLGLDGFRALTWPLLWCTPIAARREADTIRTRRWLDPLMIGDRLVADPALVIRHLGLAPDECYRQPDGVTKRDRIELAVEHALREGLITLSDLACSGGHATPELAVIRKLRGKEPATESYAETRAAQLLRANGWRAWRQLQIMSDDRVVQRADFLLAYDRCRARRT
jgi:hypothetical protein